MSTVLSATEHTATPSSHSPAPSLRVLALGMGWQPEQPGNGLDRMYHALTTTLPRVGVEVEGLVAGSDEVAVSSAGRVAAFGSLEDGLVGRLRGLRRSVRARLDAQPVDLVAAHFALHTAPVLDLIRPLPLVVHFHGPWALESAVEGESPWTVRAKAALERLVYRRATRFIVLSDAFRHVLVDEYGASPDRICIVPGGTDVDRFDTGLSRIDARRRLGWPVDRPIVLSVRRLVPRMGLDHLVDAAHELRRLVPEVLICIAGKGPLASALDERIRREGLIDTVRLLGYVPDEDLPYAYRAATFTVVPSAALEGFGLITVESLAAGTPALVTPVGGLPETVRGLSEALVLPDASVGALVDRMGAVLTGALSLPDGATCQSYARHHYSWTTVARRVRDVYASVL